MLYLSSIWIFFSPPSASLPPLIAFVSYWVFCFHRFTSKRLRLRWSLLLRNWNESCANDLITSGLEVLGAQV